MQGKNDASRRIRYEKAVRDKIPDIIRASGRGCTVRRVPDDEFLVNLEAKLAEETAEYARERTVAELADVVQVAYRIAELRGSARDDFERIMAEKRERRGGFDANLFLVDADAPDEAGKSNS